MQTHVWPPIATESTKICADCRGNMSRRDNSTLPAGLPTRCRPVSVLSAHPVTSLEPEPLAGGTRRGPGRRRQFALRTLGGCTSCRSLRGLCPSCHGCMSNSRRQSTDGVPRRSCRRGGLEARGDGKHSGREALEALGDSTRSSTRGRALGDSACICESVRTGPLK